METADWLDDDTCLTRDDCIAELLASLPKACMYCRLSEMDVEDE